MKNTKFEFEIVSCPEDEDDGNLDVTVRFKENNYVATFYTYQNILTLSERYKETGDCLNGKYFWGTDMILIKKLSSELIEEVIQELLDDDSFHQAFCLIEDDVE